LKPSFVNSKQGLLECIKKAVKPQETAKLSKVDTQVIDVALLLQFVIEPLQLRTPAIWTLDTYKRTYKVTFVTGVH
jgi:hypothetical protein